ncbi:MAG TPA: TraB/GumN family protein [Kofleriaceae bacterium]|nr:TraB/GumN family protein [Kofleriaceae bacterium]
MRRHHLRATLLSLLGLTSAASVSIGCGSAATSAASSSASAAADPRPDDHGLRGPLLWEVQGPRASSYLFGTLHLGFRADRDLPDWVWDKLRACDTFVMETNLSKVDVLEVTRLASLPDGQSLADMLPTEDWQELVQLTGLPESTLQSRQPWFASHLVFQQLYPTPVPLDLALMQRASEMNKEIAFLEDWKFQLQVLARTITAKDLGELLGPDGDGRRLMADLIAAYRAGDLERLAAIAEQERAEDPQRHDLLLAARNRDWVPKLRPHLDRGRTFVAVGAAHFPGGDGLIELLRAEGYVLTRVVRP